MQALGNICLGLAGLLYLLPLQHLLLELARKKDDGGGVLAGAIILIPMWVLLLAGLLLATARGGFDGLPMGRGALRYVVVIAATLTLAFVTFLSLTTLGRPTWTTRLLFGWPVYLMPLLTIAFVAGVINPGLAGTFPPALVRAPWVIVAGLSLLGCMGYFGYQVAASTGRSVIGLTHQFSGDRELAERDFARVPTLDPVRDFEELLKLANPYTTREVRESAVARLRLHPQFLDTLITCLGDKRRGDALQLLEFADFTPDERRRLAAPACEAMLAFAGDARLDLKHAPDSRRTLARRWGLHLYRTIAKRFADTGVDFAPALAAFEQVFAPAADEAA